MNPDEISKRLDEMNQKIDEVSRVVRQLKNYFKWTLIVTIVLFVLPLIGLVFAIPSYLNTLNTITSF